MADAGAVTELQQSWPRTPVILLVSDLDGACATKELIRRYGRDSVVTDALFGSAARQGRRCPPYLKSRGALKRATRSRYPGILLP